MKIAIVGTRTFDNLSVMKFLLKEYSIEGKSLLEYKENFSIISGGAEGVDTLAEKYAEHYGFTIEVIKPDYDRFGKLAPLERNSEIALRADVCIAFVNETSRGTWDTIKKFKNLQKPVKVFDVSDKGLNESGLEDWVTDPKDHEERRRGGELSFPAAMPRYRLAFDVGSLGNKTADFVEGGYFHYREEAEFMKNMLLDKVESLYSNVRAYIYEMGLE